MALEAESEKDIFNVGIVGKSSEPQEEEPQKAKGDHFIINPFGSVGLEANGKKVFFLPGDYDLVPVFFWAQYRLDIIPKKINSILSHDKIVAYINKNQINEEWIKLYEHEISTNSPFYVPWGLEEFKYNGLNSIHDRTWGLAVETYYHTLQVFLHDNPEIL